MDEPDLLRQVERLGVDEWQARSAAFSALQQRGAAAVGALIQGADHPNWRVRRGCADLMDHLADDRCVGPLLRLLRDPVAAVRRAALHALGCQGCKACPLRADSVAHLVESAQGDGSIRARRVAVHLLGCQAPDSRAAAALRAILEREADAKLLSNARWALAQHQPSAAPPPDSIPS